MGRLLGLKGAHFAIRAVAEALRRHLPVEFIIVGQGPYKVELRQVAQRVGVADRIRWISHMPQQELFSLYQTMHCLLFPSLHESGGSIALEVQAKGLPVVCLGIGGPTALTTPEATMQIDVHGLNEEAVVQQLADAIETVCGDKSRRVPRGDVGRLVMLLQQCRGKVGLEAHCRLWMNVAKNLPFGMKSLRINEGRH